MGSIIFLLWAVVAICGLATLAILFILLWVTLRWLFTLPPPDAGVADR
jgi:hypothetical protein